MNRPNKLPPRDIYPGLDDELDAIYERNVSEGIAVPIERAPEAELGAVVAAQLKQTGEASLSDEVRGWAVAQLQPAQESWIKFDANLDHPLPQPLAEIGSQHNNFKNIIERLYKAKQVL